MSIAPDDHPKIVCLSRQADIFLPHPGLGKAMADPMDQAVSGKNINYFE